MYLMTGGYGRLGNELQKILPEIGRDAFDVTKPNLVRHCINSYAPKVIIHAAAFTDVVDAENNRKHCWNVNVNGTRNVAQIARENNIFLIHISTDYVFWGDRGMYSEDDPVGPVRNYYALSKLAAEEVVKTVEKHLIIRTSFRPSEWPYEVAYDDLYTSQDYIDVIAPEIALAIKNYKNIPYDIIHIATDRKSAYELAIRRKPNVVKQSKSQARVALPDDISLDITRWENCKRYSIDKH